MSPTTAIVGGVSSGGTRGDNSVINRKMDRSENDRSVSTSSSDLISPQPSTSSYPTDQQFYVKEEERLKTFSDWDVPFLHPTTMTSAGFYFLHRADVVRCAFCGVEIGNWEEGDDPQADHKKWAPNCSFVLGRATANVPLAQQSITVRDMDEAVGQDTCGRFGINLKNKETVTNASSSEAFLETLGIQKKVVPSFPQYSNISSRMSSFEQWPISLKLKPNALSEAGFFYTGKGDQTICFQCGGGLKDWEETDKPWIEHARWFPKCHFVLITKGKEFIDDVCRGKLKDVGRSASASTLEISETEKRQTSGSPDLFESSGSSGVHSRSSSLSDESPITDTKLCKICYKNEMGIVFLPCGHLIACAECAPSLQNCAVCRTPIDAIIRAFIS